jgi:hypothetical protein
MLENCFVIKNKRYLQKQCSFLKLYFGSTTNKNIRFKNVNTNTLAYTTSFFYL